MIPLICPGFPCTLVRSGSWNYDGGREGGSSPAHGKCTFHHPGCEVPAKGPVIPCLLAEGTVLVHVYQKCLLDFVTSHRKASSAGLQKFGFPSRVRQGSLGLVPFLALKFTTCPVIDSTLR